jgi:hypothetical protein
MDDVEVSAEELVHTMKLVERAAEQAGNFNSLSGGTRLFRGFLFIARLFGDRSLRLFITGIDVSSNAS